MYLVKVTKGDGTFYLQGEGLVAEKPSAQRFATPSQAWWSLINRGSRLVREGFRQFELVEG